MAKVQFPIDGKLGKQYKVTSEFGWRIHPVKKEKKHHNGVDLWGAAEPIYIEAFYDGVVLYAGPSKTKKENGEPGGFGYYVTLLHKIDGVFYTSLYAHMQKGSLQVKKGQKVQAGTVLGKMGATGMVTGKHLHWEIWKGKTHGWTNNGKGFLDPMKFTAALIAAWDAKSFASTETPEDAPVQAAPTHGTKPAAAPVAKPVAKPVAAKAVKPKLTGELKVGSSGDAVTYLQTKLGVPATGKFDAATKAAVIKFQKSRKEITKPDGIVGQLTWKALG